MKLPFSRHSLRYVLGILVSAIFVYLTFRKVDVSGMYDAFMGADCWILSLAGLVMFGGHYFRALRWGYLLSPIKRLDLGSLFSSLMIGYAANVVLPAHLGEFLRSYVLGRKGHVSASSALATIVVERIIDVLSLLALTYGTILLLPVPRWLSRGGHIIFVASVGVLVFILGCKIFWVQIRRIFEVRLNKYSHVLQSKIRHVVEGFLSGIVPLRRRLDYFLVLKDSVLIWLCYGLFFHLCLVAFGFFRSYDLPWYSSLVLLIATTIGIMIPSSPGYIGTYHYLCQLALGYFGVPPGPALSFALIVHGLSVLPPVLVGLILANREGLKIFDAVPKRSGVLSGDGQENRVRGYDGVRR
jgi:uncharacterized protein (TIRG00374 family)